MGDNKVNERDLEDSDRDYCYFRIKLLYHPSSAQDPDPDRITFIAYITSALTINQGLFGSAINIDIMHCLGMECWIRLHKEDKQKVWVALSSWSKDIEDGSRVLSWEIVRIAKSKVTIAEGIDGFPNQPLST